MLPDRSASEPYDTTARQTRCGWRRTPSSSRWRGRPGWPCGCRRHRHGAVGTVPTATARRSVGGVDSDM